MNRLRTHRGFTVENAPGVSRGYLDLPLVDMLYKRMETTHNWEHDFSYLTDVVRAAKQVLFNQRGQFILAHQLRTTCSPWVLHFTVNTLRYLNGEPRQLSLENYRDLMVFHPRDEVLADHSALIRTHDLGWLFSATPEEIICKWLSCEDGLTDLVLSLHLVGGSLPADWHDRSEAV